MKKVLIPLLVAAALVVAVLGVGAGFAQTTGSTAADSFLAKVAAKLGIGEDELKTAVDEAYNETIDEQVAAGDLTQDQADRLKERGFELAPMFGLRPGVRIMIGGVEVMQSAADVLGISVDDLMTQLRDCKSLADVAEAQGVSVDTLKTELLAKVKSELDTAVSDGKITQSQADEMYSHVENNIDNIINATGPFRGRCHGGEGPGPMEAPSDSAMPGSRVGPEMGL